MSELNSIRFHFEKIVTDQYAVIDGIFKLGQPIAMSSQLGFGFADDEPIIKIGGSFSFFQHDKVFLKLAVSCFYRIQVEDWAHIYRKAENKFVLPKDPALHLASLVVGVARGVLHAKTENEPFNSLILPTINIYDQVEGDIESSIVSEEKEKV